MKIQYNFIFENKKQQQKYSKFKILNCFAAIYDFAEKIEKNIVCENNFLFFVHYKFKFSKD
jgi:hypothetical protein